MADCIIAGTGGGGVSSDDLTARAAHVLAGKKFVGEDTDDDIGVGAMPNNGQVSRTLRAGENLQIARGYHDGTGVVNAAPLADQTAGNAGTGDILSGKTAWVNGQRVDGSIPVFNTMGPHGIDPRGSLTTEYGIDLNARTLWMHAPAHNAYYMREDGHPHICMDSEALGDATAQQVLQGCTFTSKHGMKAQGAIYRWPVSGDIGGQRVMDAYENTAFIGDYGARGRGVFMRMPGGCQIDPTCMWAFAPMPDAIGRNFRAGANIGGVPGELVDYAATCVPFDGARFDGVHLSGWASGELSKNFFKASLDPTALFDGGYNRRWYSWSPWWGFTPSVHAGAFRAMRVTVHTYTDGVSNSMSLKLHLVRIGGVEHKRDFTPIRTATLNWAPGYTQGYIHTEWHTVEINCADINEQAFLVVNLQTDEIRPRGQANGYRFSADVTRVELIA